ncbi:hypothetical protein [Streptomyces sporangiiformans]|uniref:hypothetical protein n=1 Tax=Streptomyces sporangiiformans TaxID=2315329 RepID=UPI001F09EB65|nr:hypothetical protein [Streptomyces sporangiiformans]
MEHINLKRYIRERMDQVLADEPDEVREAYVQARTEEHREQLDAIVAGLLAKHGLAALRRGRPPRRQRRPAAEAGRLGVSASHRRQCQVMASGSGSGTA